MFYTTVETQPHFATTTLETSKGFYNKRRARATPPSSSLSSCSAPGYVEGKGSRSPISILLAMLQCHEFPTGSVVL